jgi:MFS family permease
MSEAAIAPARVAENYQRIWLWLCIGWTVSAADRTVAGPVITWMIQNRIAFMATDNPYALGGIIGGIFFTGYMLAQFPGGYSGDRHGNRSVIVISLLWAALGTMASGLAGGLIGFVAARVFTGLGEGAYYANDRAVIAQTTPEERRSLGMGVVISGLSIGITLATLGTPSLLSLGRALLGVEAAWRMPFYVLALLTFGATLLIRRALAPWAMGTERPAAALLLLARYTVPFFVLILGLFLAARFLGIANWALSLLELALAAGLIAFIYERKRGEIAGALGNRDLLLLYVSAIAILWNLWFFGFWAVSIVAGSSGSSFLRAALTAAFSGLAGIAGFPVGGWLADRALGWRGGRKSVLLGFTLLQGLLTLALAVYLQQGGRSAITMATLLFASGFCFAALQPASHALTARIATPDQRGSAFGMWNLIGEIGAVLSPVISGTLRDATGGWAIAVYLDAALILVSFALLTFLREPRVAPPGR